VRKYIVRKNFDEKNIDPLNVPQQSVFFQKDKAKHSTTSRAESDNDQEQSELNFSKSTKQEMSLDKNEDILSTQAKKLFDESLSAMTEYDKKRMDNIYKQLDTEKQLSRELNSKLHKNLKKIAKAETELVKKKNQLQMELDEKTKQLVESERFSAIGELSGRLAHELRTPLTVIKCSVELIKMRSNVTEDDFVAEKLKMIEESMQRMNHQVNQVLSYVQKTPIQKKNVSLNKTITNALNLVSINPNIRVILPENDILFYCDSTKMEIMFVNLLLNSVQAIRKESGEIIIKTEESDDSIKITLQDSGKGVSKNDVPNIFKPMFSTKQDGTGLGLSGVKNIIEQHKGTISFQNNPTVFTITLPRFV